jgi:hypothetical protein
MAHATNSSPILGYLAYIGRGAIPQLREDLVVLVLGFVVLLLVRSLKLDPTTSPLK